MKISISELRSIIFEEVSKGLRRQRRPLRESGTHPYDSHSLSKDEHDELWADAPHDDYDDRYEDYPTGEMDGTMGDNFDDDVPTEPKSLRDTFDDSFWDDEMSRER